MLVRERMFRMAAHKTTRQHEPMLSDAEKTRLVTLAEKGGDSSAAKELMRALCRFGRVGDLYEAIRTYSNACEINKTAVQRHLESHIAGMLSNHYFDTSFGREWYEAFVVWSLDNTGWSQRIQEAQTRDEILAAISQVKADVEATM